MNKETKIKLLEVYRKHNNYSLVKLLEDPNKCAICSRNTYRKLLNGEFIRFEDEIIESIFIRLKRPLITLPFTLDFKPLSKAMEYSFNDEAIIECQKLIDQLEPYKKNALYDVYYRQLNIILNYYQDNSCPNEEEVLKELDYMPMIEKELSDLVYVMFMYSHNTGVWTGENEWVDLLCQKSEHVLANICECCFYLNELRFGESLKMIETIDNKIREDNIMTLLYFMPYKIRIYQISNIECGSLLEEIDLLLKENKQNLPIIRSNVIYANLIVIELFRKNYRKALEFIENMQAIDGIRRVHIEIYRMFCMSQLEIAYKHKSLCVTSLSLDFPSVIDVYMYFINANLTSKRKNKKLLRITREKLLKDDLLYYFMFEEEITKNCRTLNRFKDLCDFKLIKDAKMSEK
ncbi:MAG: hypothetical protein R3Y57_02970 [Erysipelotrichaceae bacterium]